MQLLIVICDYAMCYIYIMSHWCRNPSTASPMVTVALYRELVEDKGLALVRADFLPSVKRQVGVQHGCAVLPYMLVLLIFISVYL